MSSVFCGPTRRLVLAHAMAVRQGCSSSAKIAVVASSRTFYCSIVTNPCGSRISASFMPRSFATQPPQSANDAKTVEQDQDQTKPDEAVAEISEIIYEGALAGPTLRLKRVSITTCGFGLLGLPLMAVLYGAGIPATGQLAVGGTAIFAATGSTAALSYCVSPYVHTLEKIPAARGREGELASYLIKATTRNILGMKVETIFNPVTDVVHYTGSRPFCNFIAKGVPMYVHPELIGDETLRAQLVGERAAAKVLDQKEAEEQRKKQDDDDLF